MSGSIQPNGASMRAITFLFTTMFGCSDAGVKTFNSAPTVDITSHADGDTIQEGATEVVLGQVGDPNHSFDDLSVTWTIGGERVCTSSTPDAAGLVLCEHTFGPEAGAVSLAVRDPDGDSAVDAVTLVVQPTDAPVALINAPSSAVVYYSNVLTTLSGEVSDTEDLPSSIIVTWESSLDGVLEGSFNVPDSEGGLLGAINLSKGEHFVTLTARDSTGKEGRDSITMQVGPPNSPPTCTITAPESGEAGSEGELVIFEGVAGDPDVPSDGLKVAWASDKDGAIGESSPASSGAVTFPTNALSVNTHVITMTVSDEIGETCTSNLVFTVGTPPEITITAPTSGDTLHHESAVVFSAEVSDNEDLPTAVALIWSSDVDGVFSEAGADSSGMAEFSNDALSPGDHVVTVTATDSDGLYVTDAVSFHLNQAPTTPLVAIGPDPAVTTDNLVATATGSTDPEGTATITYSYVWFEDGLASTASSSATFPAGFTTKHHTYRVRVTASDGLTEGASAEAETTVINSAPVLLDLHLSATTVASGDTVNCIVSATDVDVGDSPTISFVWSDGSTGASYTVTPADDVGSVVICTATADDGDGGTASTSASATVANSTPTIDWLTLTPASGQVGETLTCVASASDPDGDAPTLSFLWTDGSAGPS